MNSSTYRAEDWGDLEASLIAKQVIFQASLASQTSANDAQSFRAPFTWEGLDPGIEAAGVLRSATFGMQVDEAKDNDEMTSVTKDILDARLEAVEARMDARMVRIEGLVSGIAKSQEEIAASHKSTRNTIIGTGIAVVLGIAAFNATVLSNMVASFESGKNTATSQAASEKAIVDVTKALEALTEKAKQASSAKK